MQPFATEELLITSSGMEHELMVDQVRAATERITEQQAEIQGLQARLVRSQTAEQEWFEEKRVMRDERLRATLRP